MTDLAARLLEIARAAVEDAGARALTVDELVRALEAVTAELPAALEAALADDLPGIARQAISEAEGEIATAREASGLPFPTVDLPRLDGFGPWLAEGAAALIAGAVAAAGEAASVADARRVAVQAVTDGAHHVSAAASTASARVENEARLSTFRANSDIVPRLIFDARDDDKTSDTCNRLDDVTFSINAPDIPRPPLHPFCRSRLRPVLDDGERSMEAVECRFAPRLTTEGEFRGIASAYGVLDQHGTEFAPGAFAASIDERRADGGRFPLLLHHDQTRVAGAITDLHDTPTGLEVIGRFTLGTPAGDEGYRLARDGALSLSVGFRRIADRPRRGGGRIITEARLVECSAVAVASNPRTRITEVRSTAARGAANHGGSSMEHDTAAPETRAANDDTIETRMGEVTSTLTEIRTAVDGFGKRLDKVEARAGRTGVAAEPKGSAIDIERRALADFARTGDDAAFREVRSMWTGSDPDGGYLVMPEISGTMMKRLYDETPMRRLCRTETITRGDEWVEPLDLDDIGAEWVGEREARPETDGAQLDVLTIPLREIYAHQKVTQRLLDDAGINLGSWLEGKISDKFVRAEGAAFISAVNTPKRPAGLLSYPTAATADASRAWGTLQFVKSGSASTITADGLKNLVWSLRAPYRSGAVFLMNSNTANTLDTLTDSEGRYLWRSSMLAGAPNSLLGYPVVFDENMPDIAGGAFPIAFGDFRRAYLIVDKLGIRFIRDNLTDVPNVKFYGYRRVGGGLANSEAVKLHKIAS